MTKSVIVALVSVSVVLINAYYFLVSYGNSLALDVMGEKTTGVVTKIYSYQSSKSHYHQVYYSFKADLPDGRLKFFASTTRVDWELLCCVHVGSQVPVIFLPAKPDVSDLGILDFADRRASAVHPARLIPAFFALLLLAAMSINAWQIAKERKFLRYGRPRPAKIEEYLKGAKTKRVVYTFTNLIGQETEGVLDEIPVETDFPNPTVLVLSDDGKKHLLYMPDLVFCYRDTA